MLSSTIRAKLVNSPAQPVRYLTFASSSTAQNVPFLNATSVDVYQVYPYPSVSPRVFTVDNYVVKIQPNTFDSYTLEISNILFILLQ
jgi:hypothetical protein